MSSREEGYASGTILEKAPPHFGVAPNLVHCPEVYCADKANRARRGTSFKVIEARENQGAASLPLPEKLNPYYSRDRIHRPAPSQSIQSTTIVGPCHGSGAGETKRGGEAMATMAL